MHNSVPWVRITTKSVSYTHLLIDSSTYFKALACDHFRRIKKNAYTIVKSNAVNALDLSLIHIYLQHLERLPEEVRVEENRPCIDKMCIRDSPTRWTHGRD